MANDSKTVKHPIYSTKMIWRSILHNRVVQIIDITTSIIIFIFAYYLTGLTYQFSKIFGHPFSVSYEHIILLFINATIIIFLFYIFKAYSYQRYRSLGTEYLIILKVATWDVIILISIIFLFRLSIPRTIVVLLFLTFIFLFFIQKTLMFFISTYFRQHGHSRKRILVIGTGKEAQEFINVVQHNYRFDLDLIGLVTADPGKIGNEFYGLKVLNHLSEMEKILKIYNPEEVIIAIPIKHFNHLKNVLEICGREGVQIRIYSDLFEIVKKKYRIDNIHGLDIISYCMTSQTEAKLIVKRILDIIGASFALVLFSPFMLIATIGIWISDGRPIFFEWNVIG